MAIFSRVKHWYNGERKVTAHESSTDSMLMAFTTSHIEYHWSTRIARDSRLLSCALAMALDNGDYCLLRNCHIQVILARKPNNSFKPAR